ncbi:hypothetical protein FQN57_001493 [Myotisia sp. PD_48]|nr:hypothetical protein FQN57_001493 [Myotisia sp. PD_48]
MGKSYYTGRNNWIGDSFNEIIFNFTNGTRWGLDEKITEKSYVFYAEWHPETNDKTSETQAVYYCHQVAGPELNKKAVIKIRLQVPPERAEKERIILQYLARMKCSSSPQLFDSRLCRQSDAMPVPNGYLLVELMERLPGITLDEEIFWKYGFEKRQKIRASFQRAFDEIGSLRIDPLDTRLPNLIYDEINDKWLKCGPIIYSSPASFCKPYLYHESTSPRTSHNGIVIVAMVLDALGSLGLAANVIQLAHFTSSLISKTYEIYNARPEGTVKERELLLGSQRLGLLADSLTKTLDEQPKSGNLSASEASLLEVSGECKRIAGEFNNRLESVVSAGKKTAWESFSQAVKATFNRDGLERMDRCLKEQKEALLTHLFVVLISQEKLNLETLKTQANDIGSIIVSEFDRVRHSLRDGVPPAFAEGKGRSESSHNEEWKKWCAEHHQEFLQATTNISSILNERNIITEKILKSLYFAEINDRYLGIHEAHKHTFDWIFDKTSSISDHTSFINWLGNTDNTQDLYWISGKPGSGKSTLMRFLFESPKTEDALQAWSASRTLLSASAFFWNSGTDIQKSLTGLLRSLLFQLLEKQPDIVRDIVRPRWRSYEVGVSPSEWIDDELMKTFDRLINLTSKTHRIALFIDGLDEYHSGLTGQRELIKFLKSLARRASVKLCVSSRPWPEFKTAFTRFPTLKLEDLTRGDIERFVQDELGNNAEFSLFEGRDEDECESLMEEVVDRAQGVFLWVFLVVKSLMQRLIKGDTMLQLTNHLNKIPPDLNDYFKLILEGVDAEDKGRAGLYLKVKLASEVPLDLMELSLVEYIQDGFELLDYLKDKPPPNLQPSNIDEQLLLAARRLQSRCKGLLEAHRRWHNGTGPFFVDYLHRTVRDFLQEEDIQAALNASLPKDFDAHEFLCQAYLVWIKIAQKISRGYDVTAEFSTLLEVFFEYALEMEIHSDHSTSSLSRKAELVDIGFGVFAACRSRQNPDFGTRISTAVQYGLQDYVSKMLSLVDHPIFQCKYLSWPDMTQPMTILERAIFGLDHAKDTFTIYARARPRPDRMFPVVPLVEAVVKRVRYENEYKELGSLIRRALSQAKSDREDPSGSLSQTATILLEHAARRYGVVLDQKHTDLRNIQVKRLLKQMSNGPKRSYISGLLKRLVAGSTRSQSHQPSKELADWQLEQDNIYNHNKIYMLDKSFM